MNIFHWLSFFVVCVLSNTILASKYQRVANAVGDRQFIRNAKSSRVLISNDFENGVMTPWYNESPGNVNWAVEDFASPIETNNPAPKPTSGSKYLRAVRNQQSDPGSVILRSETFTASPGDKVSFSYWIRSHRPEGNTLELVMRQGNIDVKLIDVSSYSTPNNIEWRAYASSNVPIPVSVPTNISLAFIGYCGFNTEDAIAIDNIYINVAIDPSATTTVITSPPTQEATTTETTTQSTTTTPSTTETTTTPTTTEITTTPTTPTTTETTTVLTTTVSTTVSTTTETTTTPTTTIPASTTVADCGNKFTAPTKVITSPNYPNNYDRTSDCVYTIDTSPTVKRLNLTFTDFNTASQDYVTIYDGLVEDINTLIFRASGADIPSPIITSGNKCTITFVAKALAPSTGWSLTYS